MSSCSDAVAEDGVPSAQMVNGVAYGCPVAGEIVTFPSPTSLADVTTPFAVP